jgi:hypothetical protein
MIRDILFSPFMEYPLLGGLILILIMAGLGKAFWELRRKYLQHMFLLKTEWTLLEIIIPGDITRSPEAMEIFFINAIWWDKGTGGNFYKDYFQGETRTFFSFEIVSIGGVVHFFIYTPVNLKDLVRSQLYAQFPQIEINEVPDYTDRLPMHLRDANNIGMFAWEYKFDKPNAYPIRTYRDWGTDKSFELDSEQQIDPLGALIEKLAAIDPWEELWLQYVVRLEKDDAWRIEGEKIIDSIITSHRRVVKSDFQGTPLISSLTKGEQESIDAIDRHTGHRHAFEIGIRSVFITYKPEKFNSTRTTFLKGIFEPFNSQSINTLKKVNPTGYDNPWEDHNGYIEYMLKDKALERYRRRWFFEEQFMSRDLWDPFLYLINNYRRSTMIMTSEELATIFHFPAGFTHSPNVKRTDTRKAQPPSNLPM